MFFKTELADAFADADAVVVSQSRAAGIARAGRTAGPEEVDAGFEDVPARRPLICRTRTPSWRTSRKSAEGGDVVCVFSNGGFGGIHGKLLERLGRR